MAALSLRLDVALASPVVMEPDPGTCRQAPCLLPRAELLCSRGGARGRSSTARRTHSGGARARGEEKPVT
jgi:hypothetical protein